MKSLSNKWSRAGKVGQWTGVLDGMLDCGLVHVVTKASRFRYSAIGGETILRDAEVETLKTQSNWSRYVVSKSG
jgi:hypothetical protein